MRPNKVAPLSFRSKGVEYELDTIYIYLRVLSSDDLLRRWHASAPIASQYAMDLAKSPNKWAPLSVATCVVAILCQKYALEIQKAKSYLLQMGPRYRSRLTSMLEHSQIMVLTILPLDPKLLRLSSRLLVVDCAYHLENVRQWGQ